jgi:hypothetical protein
MVKLEETTSKGIAVIDLAEETPGDVLSFTLMGFVFVAMGVVALGV